VTERVSERASKRANDRGGVTRAPARRPDELFRAAADGDRAAKARLLSLIERGGEDAREVGRLAAPLAGNAYTIGLTGAPGAGKSTLTSSLITHLRTQGDEVAVLAVDPSSPFTGGAILGDRVRMQEHSTDPGVFIRSMATRGHLGGLSLATPEAIRLLDALGHRWIVVETVGVGQVEVEVAGKADTTVVVVNPGWGDSVQAAKAGLMEVADVFAINKADRPGVDETRRDLQQMLELAADTAVPSVAGWAVPIVATVGSKGDGVVDLWDAAMAHRAHMLASGVLEQRRRFRLGEELREIVIRRLEARARELCTGERWDELTSSVLARDIDPWTAADQMLHPVLSFTSGPIGPDPEDGSGSATPAGTSARR
jgi:GTPase